jgi:hypothetical protein
LPNGGLWLLPWVVDVARAVRRTILTTRRHHIGKMKFR